MRTEEFPVKVHVTIGDGEYWMPLDRFEELVAVAARERGFRENQAWVICTCGHTVFHHTYHWYHSNPKKCKISGCDCERFHRA